MGEELNRSLLTLAERGVPRGAAAVLDAARIEATSEAELREPTWQRGLVVAFGAAAAVLVLVGAVLLFARPFGGEETPPATTVAPVPTTVPVTPTGRVESSGPLNDVNDLAFAPDGRLWAATGAGLVEWDISTGEYLVVGEEHGLPAGQVEDVEVAPDGTVWSLGNGWIARYDGSWRVFLPDDVPELNGQLVDLAVDSEGVIWVGVSSEPIARFDGEWSTVDPSGAGELVAIPDGLAVAPNGTLWAVSHFEGVFAFDGSKWKRQSTEDGAPERITGMTVAPNGDLWAWGAGFYSSAEGGDYTPPTGFARFDGNTWYTYTTDDGLLADDGSVVVAPDGTVWVLHGELGPDHEPVPTRLSRFDGASWTTYDAPGDHQNGGWSQASAAADGALWIPGADGIVGFDGTDTILLTVPAELAAPPLVAAAMTPATDVDPTWVSTVIGDLEFTTMQLPTGREFWVTEATPHGPVAVAIDGSALYWTSDGVTWEAIRTDVDPWWISTDGDDVILHRDGFVRYAWDGTGWFEKATVDLPGNLQGIAFSPRGAVAVVENAVHYSSDGVSFLPAALGPSRDPLADGQGRCEIQGPSSSGGARDTIGPVLATEEGFVIFTPAHAADWDRSPVCEPLVWFSADGSTWELTSEDSPFGKGAAVHDIAEHDGRYVAVGGITASEEGAIWTSGDAVNWERADVQLEGAISVAAGDVGWMVAGPSIEMWFSADGLTWDGPYEGPEALFGLYWRTEPAVGTESIYVVGGGHDTYLIGRLLE
jgi:sugar lactone lactonase YvrE